MTFRVWQAGSRRRAPRVGLDAAADPRTSRASTSRSAATTPLSKTVYGRLAGDPTVLALPDSFLDELPEERRSPSATGPS